MAACADFTLATDCQVFFCDPHSPWQRPTNENLNGLVRDFYPKGTNFRDITDTQIAEMQDLLNGRPRRVLQWHTPTEKWPNYSPVVHSPPETAGSCVSCWEVALVSGCARPSARDVADTLGSACIYVGRFRLPGASAPDATAQGPRGTQAQHRLGAAYAGRCVLPFRTQLHRERAGPGQALGWGLRTRVGWCFRSGRNCVGTASIPQGPTKGTTVGPHSRSPRESIT